MKLGVNIGSGQRPFTSTPEVRWVNVDSQAKWEPDIVCDGASLPIGDESADYVVLHHVLEHFQLGDGDALIREAHRVLKTGGSLLVFLPDIKALARRWLAGEIDDYIFTVSMMGAYMGDVADIHKWHYTEAGLHRLLTSCGEWNDIKAFDWREIGGLTAARDWWILDAEAIR